MTSTLQSGAQAVADTVPTRRKAGLGTVPDFTFRGAGVWLTGGKTGSAAEAAGMEKDDIIVTLDHEDINDLAEFAAALKTYKPGDKMRVGVLRDGKPLSVEAVLDAR